MLMEEQIETKVATTGATNLNHAFDDLMRALGEHREANDRRLAEIERRMSADVVTVDKLARLDAVIAQQGRIVDELALKAARPPLGGSSAATVGDRERKSAFDAYVRRGADTALQALEAKALSAGTASDGGYLVPVETEATVNRALRDLSPIRAIAGVRQVSGSTFQKPYAVGDMAAGWVGETASRTQTGTPSLAALSFPTMELYAMPAATQTLLDDAAVDIDAWIAEEVRAAFALQEGQAFVTGDGVNKPKGFLAYPTVANASWSWGNVGYLATGTAGSFPAASPTDKLIDLTFSVKAAYRANARFVMNRATLAVIRKFKDSAGQYIWQPAGRPGEPSSLLGHPVAECEEMPGIAADAFGIAFGDFSRGYLVVDRIGIRVLRDPYTAKPYVLFYTTKRVGGGIQDFDAIKLLKFAA